MSTNRSIRRPFRAANPVSSKLLLIWRQLDKREREQVITAAFGILRWKVGDTAGVHLTKATLKVLFRSDARAQFDKVMLCGPDKSWSGTRRKYVGRYQRLAQWLTHGNLIAPDWRCARMRGAA